MNTNLEIFYSVYEVDKNRNKQLICGAKIKEIAEKALHDHPGYESAVIEWGSEIIYVSHFQPAICEGRIISK